MHVHGGLSSARTGDRRTWRRGRHARNGTGRRRGAAVRHGGGIRSGPPALGPTGRKNGAREGRQGARAAAPCLCDWGGNGRRLGGPATPMDPAQGPPPPPTHRPTHPLVGDPSFRSWRSHRQGCPDGSRRHIIPRKDGSDRTGTGAAGAGLDPEPESVGVGGMRAGGTLARAEPPSLDLDLPPPCLRNHGMDRRGPRQPRPRDAHGRAPAARARRAHLADDGEADGVQDVGRQRPHRRRVRRRIAARSALGSWRRRLNRSMETPLRQVHGDAA